MTEVARKIIMLCCFCSMNMLACAQFTIGTTGLMHLPTAEMQRDKTFMAGWSWLDTSATPNDKNYGWDREPTMNYYINITFFPWLEVSYDCTLIRGSYLAPAYNLPLSAFKKWANQDRNFSFRLRVWKEGWWKKWTPQIVVGTNDFLHTGAGNGSGQVGLTNASNGYWARMYVVATKHFELKNIATVGTHMAYLHNNREYYHYEGVGVGANIIFDKLKTGSTVADALFRPLNLMAEYDTRTFNAGASYSIWRDHINLVCEMNELKHFSGGVYFKVHLR